jgi:hypothetical protein
MVRVRRVLTAVLGLVLASLVSTVALTALPADAAAHKSWGTTGAPDRTLKKGCAAYNYHYRLTPPPGDWSLEVFLVDPDKKRVASGFFLSPVDPLKGQSSFAFCSIDTRPGIFTIKARMTVSNPYPKIRWLKPSTFRLRHR